MAPQLPPAPFPRRHTLGTAAQLALASGFCALIALPALLPAGGLGSEKRQPAPLPKLSWKSAGQFPKAFERYYGDRLGLRRLLVRTQAIVKVKLLGASPLPQVVVGRDGWLYFDEDAARGLPPSARYRGLSPWTRQQLDKAVADLERQTAWLRGRGTAFAVIVCPNKETIYPEHLPASFGRRGATTRIDQLASALADRPVPFVDPRQALLEAKGLGPLYYRTDTHWNPLGALVGYRELAGRLREDLPVLPPVRLEDFSVRVTPPAVHDGDLAVMLSLEGLLEDQRVPVKPREVLLEDAAKPGKVLVFHDSFGNALRPLLELHFGEVVMRQGPFNAWEVVSEAPDAVVLEVVERYQERLGEGVTPPPAGPSPLSGPGAGPGPAAPRG